jgi:predicted RNase H-like HicB family nuclease
MPGKIQVAVVFEPDEGGWHVYAPALKGVHSFGASRDEARRNAVEAIELWLEVAREQGLPIPETEMLEVPAS